MTAIMSRHETPLLSLPQYLGRIRTRSPSPSSSVCSQATSVDSIGDMPRIDKIRPIYDSSSSLEDKMEWLGESPAESSRKRLWTPSTHPMNQRNGLSKSTSLPSVHKTPNGSLTNGHGDVKGKSPRRFPEEEDEAILRESDSRFVLFPIKFREVSTVP